ncbi:hypothetical protein ABIA14_001245 [Sinorhizobium fredii]
MHPVFRLVKLQPVAGAAEGIGENDIGTGVDEILMQLGDVFRLGFVPEFRRFARLEAHGEERRPGRTVGKQNALLGKEIGEGVGCNGHRCFPAEQSVARYKHIFMCLRVRKQAKCVANR